MKILWLVNIVFPEAGELLHIPSSVFGGWLIGALDGIREKGEQISIVTTGEANEYHGEILSAQNGNVKYIVYPKKTRTYYETEFKKLLSENNYDIIQIFGTEYLHSVAMLNAANMDKTIIYIQGLMSICAFHFTDGIPKSYCKLSIDQFCVRKLFKTAPSIREAKNLFQKQSLYEADALKKAKLFIGRTNWDKACVLQSNSEAQYYKVNETLRDAFYRDQYWNAEQCERHSIFLSQASYPIKGLHNFIAALPIILKQFPDTKVYIAGSGANFKQSGNLLRKMYYSRYAGYLSYIYHLIKKYNLFDVIEYTGLLNEEQMVEKYLKSHVFVCPSNIENSPNSVGEAMMLGTPVVASYVGGIPDMLDNGVEGLLYQPTAPYMLADCIMRIFSDDELAMTLSRNAIKRAHITHDKKRNADALMAAYEDIINRNGEQQ